MTNYKKRLAEKEQELLKLKAENAALKEKAILFPGDEEVVLNLKDMIAIFPGNIFWRDEKGKLLGANKNLAKFCGYENPQDLIGMSNAQLMPPEQAEELSKADEEVLKTGRDFIGTELGTGADNLKRYFVSHKTAVRSKTGKIVGLIGIALDITERKKMEKDLKLAKEKAEASNQAKSQFLAVINHELRTPLACIINLLTFLKNDDLSEENREILRSMENCSQYLLNLVNEVLDFSKLETGKHSVHNQVIHLDELFNEVLNMLDPLAVSKGLTLHLESMPGVPTYILSDEKILLQILINLISNAIKFTDSGSIILRVECLNRKSDQSELAFSVIDSGFGIPPDKLKVIFEPFQQLNDPYKRQSSRSGTGLGLAIVERLVKLLHPLLTILLRRRHIGNK